MKLPADQWVIAMVFIPPMLTLLLYWLWERLDARLGKWLARLEKEGKIPPPPKRPKTPQEPRDGRMPGPDR